MQQLAVGCQPDEVAASQHLALPGGDLLLPAHNPGQNPERVGNLNVVTTQCHLFVSLLDVLNVFGSSCLVSKEMELREVVKHHPYTFTCFY